MRCGRDVINGTDRSTAVFVSSLFLSNVELTSAAAIRDRL